MLSKDCQALPYGLQEHGRYLLAFTTCSGWGVINHALSRSCFWKCSAPVNSFMLSAPNNQPEGAALSPNMHWVCSDTAAKIPGSEWLQHSWELAGSSHLTTQHLSHFENLDVWTLILKWKRSQYLIYNPPADRWPCTPSFGFCCGGEDVWADWEASLWHRVGRKELLSLKSEIPESHQHSWWHWGV